MAVLILEGAGAGLASISSSLTATRLVPLMAASPPAEPEPAALVAVLVAGLTAAAAEPGRAAAALLLGPLPAAPDAEVRCCCDVLDLRGSGGHGVRALLYGRETTTASVGLETPCGHAAGSI
jgi:hypothetical protein